MSDVNFICSNAITCNLKLRLVIFITDTLMLLWSYEINELEEQGRI